MALVGIVPVFVSGKDYFDEALTHAKDDVMMNYENYIQAFEAT